MSSKTTPRIKLNDVRLSYPSIFRKTVNPKAGPNGKLRYEATFILDKDEHAKEIETIKSHINELVTENKISLNKIDRKLICLRDGDDSEREEYKNKYTLIARSENRFPIVGKDGKTPVEEDEGVFYGGCYVSAYVSLYLYDKLSTGISANLLAIQFKKNGTPLGVAPFNIEGAFEPVESPDDLF
jgi:hypothetical protein